MPNQNLTHPLDQNAKRTQRAAAILAAVAALVWGAAAVLTSQDTATAVVDGSAPITESPSNDIGNGNGTDTDTDQSPAVPPTEPVGPTEPPEPQVPVGGNGDLAPTPTTDPPSCGGMCVAPVDLHPFEIQIGRVPAGIGLANSVAGGCSSKCIRRAQVFPSDESTDFAIEVETHTPAFIAIYVDNEEPHVTNDGRPYFPGSQPMVNTHGDLDTWFADTLTGLADDTEYWVIVRATDANVRSSYVVGQVVTPHLNDEFVIAFAAIDIIYDGDHGRNKGELSFEWYADFDRVGHNGEYERSTGSRIDLSDQDNVAGVFSLGGGDGPTLQMRGIERDPQGSPGFCSTGEIQNGNGTDVGCGLAWNATLPFQPTMDDIAAMADCSVFDLGDLYDGWVCTRITTIASYGGIPEYSVVVAFKMA